MKKLTNLKGAKTLSKKEQQNISGGWDPCPIPDPSLGCYTGPFYCNTGGLPICNPLDSEN